jgi:hypothetical protein
MHVSSEFLLGLLETEDPAYVSADDWAGEHGPALRLWRDLGFVDRVPGRNPIPSCPHCGEGVPYRCAGRILCDQCRSTVDPRHLHLWRLNLEAFLHWIAGQWKLRGGVRRIDGQLWQLGTLHTPGAVHECFYRRGGGFSEAARNRIAAYRQALVLYGVCLPEWDDAGRRPHLSLLELLHTGEVLSLADPFSLLRPHGNVRFERQSGTLWAGEAWLGEVPVGSKEFFLIDCLSRHLDRFVAYADLKYEVLRAADSTDSRDEATFCQRLKNRIKNKWVPEIDRLIATTNKGDGYRLRGHVEP